MFTQLAHTSQSSAKPWCGYSKPVAMPFGNAIVGTSFLGCLLASEIGEGSKRTSRAPSITLGTSDRPPGALT
ncbi:MAG: hypothetical protein IPL61_15325 [Myxococcales bacterium]|nr:hypothetical protein [Myxococcales bacterium]